VSFLDSFALTLFNTSGICWVWNNGVPTFNTSHFQSGFVTAWGKLGLVTAELSWRLLAILFWGQECMELILHTTSGPTWWDTEVYLFTLWQL
jgi:hypothetical protein